MLLHCFTKNIAMNQLYQTKTIIHEFIQVLSENRKINLRYILILVPAAICLGAICFIGAGTDAGLPAKIFQLLLFVTAGCLHLYFLNQKITLFWLRFLREEILYTVFTGLLIFISLLVFYMIAGKGMLIMSAASSGAFVLPHIVFHSWFLYSSIPEEKFDVWIRPLKPSRDDENDIIFMEHITIQLKVARKYFGAQEQVFVRKVAEGSKLGELFFAILHEENGDTKTPIEYYDRNHNLFGWVFYARKRIGKIVKHRRLDPELTLSENRLHQNSMIFIKRIRQEKEKKQIVVFSEN
jgi:type VI secretion system TssN-like protein